MKRNAAFVVLCVLLASLQGTRAENPWDMVDKKEFRQVTQGRCPIIWAINPNDPSYDTLVREKAASGVLAVIAPRYLRGDRAVDLEGGNIESWKGYYRETDWPTLGWGIVDPPVDVPRTNFPIRYERTFTEEHLKKIAGDGLLLYSYASGIEGEDALAVARKCREALGNRFIVMRKLEATNSLWPHIRNAVKKQGLWPNEATREQCFAFAKQYAEGRGKAYPEHFGIGASCPNFMQVIDILDMDRWDTELANGCQQIELAFGRGAKNQYDIPFLCYIACMNTNEDGKWGRYMPEDSPYERFYRFAYASGGKPAHLLNRMHWVTWFSDADTIVGESSVYWCFKKGKDEKHFELSDLGKKLKKLHKFADTDFFTRGDAYTPACILLDYKNGWKPPDPPDAHSWDPPGFPRRKIWGVIDYKKPDYMIDNFIGAVFPGHEMQGAWGNPYGNLVNTPYGDSFDILLTNADAAALKKYKVLFVVGNPEMTDELHAKLEDYVKSGGNLVLNAVHLDDRWKDLLGLKMSAQQNRWYKGPGILRVSDSSTWKHGEAQEEKRYFYYIVESLPQQSEVLATNPERGHPLIARIPTGKGNVYFVSVQYMQEGSGIYRPYGMTKVCKQLVENVLQPHQKVCVKGEPVEYIVRTRGNTLLVMVVNNRKEEWKGELTFNPLKKATQYKLQEWYENGNPLAVQYAVADGRVTFSDTIPANSLKLYTLE